MHYFEYYKEVKKNKPLGLRGQIRNAVLTGLSAFERIKGIEKAFEKPRVQFIYIHHLFKDEEKALKNLLEVLSKQHTFISYSEAVSKILNNEIDKPYIVFSSDDGFKNNLRAAEIFKEYNAKACFFINPGVIGETNIQTIAQHCASRLNFPPVEFLNWDEVNKLQELGHEIGAHTVNHINVAQTPEAEILKDMHECFKIISDKCGSVKHFAYPYGRFTDFNTAGKKACFEAGFTSLASAERGCHVNYKRTLQPTELCILRDHVILDWDINHVLYFLAKNSQRANINNSLHSF